MEDGAGNPLRGYAESAPVSSRLFFLTLLLLGACRGLRAAETDAPDAAPPASTSDDDDDDDTIVILPDGGKVVVKKDAGPKDAASDVDEPPETCDGPCPPETIIDGLHQVTALAVDATNVYYAIESGPTGDVWQCAKSGCNGAPIRLGPGRSLHLVVADGRVYWGDFSEGKVVACAIGGCDEAPTTLVSNQTQIRGLATDGVDLFWNTDGAVRKCPRATCSDATTKDLVTTGVIAISLDATQGRVVWPDVTKKQLLSCPTSGACANPLVLGAGTHDVSVYGGKALWTNAKVISECEVTGCDGSPRTIGSSSSPSHPVSDGVHVYWRDDFLDQILRCPVSGCAPGPDIIATKQRGQPDSEIATDGKYVYWTTTKGVYRLRK